MPWSSRAAERALFVAIAVIVWRLGPPGAAAMPDVPPGCEINDAGWPKGVIMHVYSGSDHHVSECLVGTALPKTFNGEPVICELDCKPGYAGNGTAGSLQCVQETHDPQAERLDSKFPACSCTSRTSLCCHSTRITLRD